MLRMSIRGSEMPPSSLKCSIHQASLPDDTEWVNSRSLCLLMFEFPSQDCERWSFAVQNMNNLTSY